SRNSGLQGRLRRLGQAPQMGSSFPPGLCWESPSGSPLLNNLRDATNGRRQNRNSSLPRFQKHSRNRIKLRRRTDQQIDRAKKIHRPFSPPEPANLRPPTAFGILSLEIGDKTTAFLFHRISGQGQLPRRRRRLGEPFDHFKESSKSFPRREQSQKAKSKRSL